MALIVSLPLGAWLMAAGAGLGEQAWVGWFSLLPLFAVIRLWRPGGALLAGALWGVALYAFSVGQPDAVVPATVRSLLLLALIPAGYACGGAWLTRRIGFNPFVLGVAWMGVELALGPIGLRTAPLAGAAHGQATVLHWVGQAFGYVLAGFCVALVNASLVCVLSGVRLSIPQTPRRIPSADRGASRCPETFIYSPLFAIQALRPRAPPIAVGCLR